MAYPFAPCITFHEFKDRLVKEFDCQVKQTPEVNIKGKSSPVPYFERIVDGQKLSCTFSVSDENDWVAYSVIRSTCSRLKIDPATFGLDLG